MKKQMVMVAFLMAGCADPQWPKPAPSWDDWMVEQDSMARAEQRMAEGLQLLENRINPLTGDTLILWAEYDILKDYYQYGIPPEERLDSLYGAEFNWKFL